MSIKRVAGCCLCLLLSGAARPSPAPPASPVAAAVRGALLGGARGGSIMSTILRRLALERGAAGGRLVDVLELGAVVSMEEAFEGSTNPMPQVGPGGPEL